MRYNPLRSHSRTSEIKKYMFIVLFIMLISICFAVERFPQPDFQTDYTKPVLTQPTSRSIAMQYIDVGILFIALVLASLFALKYRSRRALFILSLFSIVYFGFYKKGCVCSVGSLQNVFLSIFSNTYVITLNVLLIFILPLLFALFTGRSFCSGVCPLGAIQDLVILRPLKLPSWLRHILSYIPYLYLGYAIIFSVTETDFIICRFDPFVSIFRLNDAPGKIILGAVMLLIGVFIARPYCRFFCPYGVLLKCAALFSKQQITITPKECIRCKLCENACPFELIDKPLPPESHKERARGMKQLASLIILLPVILIIFGLVFAKMSDIIAQSNATIRLSRQIHLEDGAGSGAKTLESEAFRSNNEATDALHQKAAMLRKRFFIASLLSGLFSGMVLWIKLLFVTLYRKRTDYLPNKGNCVACGRCLDYCPVE